MKSTHATLTRVQLATTFGQITFVHAIEHGCTHLVDVGLAVSNDATECLGPEVLKFAIEGVGEVVLKDDVDIAHHLEAAEKVVEDLAGDLHGEGTRFLLGMMFSERIPLSYVACATPSQGWDERS